MLAIAMKESVMPAKDRFQILLTITFTIIAMIFATVSRANAQTAQERECRSEIATANGRYVQAVLKSISKCHKKRSKGKIAPSVNCNDPLEADPVDRLEKQRAKLRSVVDGNACNSSPSLLAQYPRCPSPGAAVDDAAATDGIDDYSELAECMIALAEGAAGQVMLESAGAPVGALTRSVAKCQTTLGKSARKLTKSYSKELRACQNELDEAGSGLGYGCSGADPDGRIAKTTSKLLSIIDKRCNVDDNPLLSQRAELNSIQACADSTAGLGSCLIDAAGDQFGAGLVAMSYGLASSCRAGSIARTSYAGYGEQTTFSSFSAGWNGIAHGIDLTDKFLDFLSISCDSDCANCALATDPRKGTAESTCRCANDPSVSCDTINDTDADCGAVDNVCNCYFGPPAAVAASGAPACIAIKLLGDHSGTVDLGTGEWSDSVDLTAVIYLGTDLSQPCPVCSGDTLANDGVRDGTCAGGDENGLPCDTNAQQPTFGPSSLDCQPSGLTNISGGGLALSVDLNTEYAEMPFTLPCDTAGESCPCRVCSGDSSVGCHDDSECAALALGTCTGGGGAGVQPNDCADRICSPSGVCDAGPTDKYCDGQTYANGRGYISCVSDADCTALSAGSCTLTENRRCFPDPIVVDGRPGVLGANLGTNSCIGLTSSAVINQASGLPGAVRVALEADIRPRCASSPSVRWDPPTGATCTTVSTTTTTTLVPPLPCGDAFPLCGAGECPPGETCQTSGLACACTP